MRYPPKPISLVPLNSTRSETRRDLVAASLSCDRTKTAKCNEICRRLSYFLIFSICLGPKAAETQVVFKTSASLASVTFLKAFLFPDF